MPDSKADLILHPIRMRIIQSLALGGRRTTQQLVRELDDIPQATMYRHLNKLLKAGILQVAEENKIRGAIEKVYYLAHGADDLTPSDVTEQSSGEHMTLFLKFISSLIGDYSQYLRQKHYDLFQDGISFRQVHLHLNDGEYAALLGEIRQIMQKHAENEAGGDRRRRMISTIVIPEVQTRKGNTVEGEGNDNEHDRSERE
ncbi:helix-turn-helix domain-containing protein [Paenibacillus sp. BR2-3]|uniref:helix-turn-helix domain-containing protein n=1 Tax=Paenibacillus sp. BR2-3 TaxID=3048494 RepID=UPI003977B3F0